jgi:hypothetical protein
MSTRALETPSVRSAGAPRLFKITATLTFVLGVLLHGARLLLGFDRLLRDFFTPPVDIAFGVLILISAVSGVMSWRRYSGGRAGRFLYGFAMFILILSVPIHFRTLLTWSTEYVRAFPSWYSVIEVPMFLALSILVPQLKFDSATSS